MFTVPISVDRGITTHASPNMKTNKKLFANILDRDRSPFLLESLSIYRNRLQKWRKVTVRMLAKVTRENKGEHR